MNRVTFRHVASVRDSYPQLPRDRLHSPAHSHLPDPGSINALYAVVAAAATAQPSRTRIRSPATHTTRGLTDDEVSRSEEHTSELQSRENLVCRLLLE